MQRSSARQFIAKVIAAAVCASAALTSAHDNGPYGLTGHTRLGFYANSNVYDAAHRRLYASSRDGVYEVDTAAPRVIGRLGDIRGAGSITMSPEFGELYVLSAHEDILRVVDVGTRKVTRSFEAPALYSVFYEASRGELYYLRGDSPSVRVVDRTTGRTIKTIWLGGHPSLVLPDPSRHRFLIRLSDRDLIHVIDATERAISVSWPITADGQSAMAIDDAGQRVFVSSGKSVKMISGLTGKEMSRFSVGDQVRSIVFDPATQLVSALWGATSNINVARVAPLGLELVQNIDPHSAVRQLFIDPVSHALLGVGTIGDNELTDTSPPAMTRSSSLLTFKFQ